MVKKTKKELFLTSAETFNQGLTSVIGLSNISQETLLNDISKLKNNIISISQFEKKYPMAFNGKSMSIGVKIRKKHQVLKTDVNYLPKIEIDKKVRSSFLGGLRRFKNYGILSKSNQIVKFAQKTEKVYKIDRLKKSKTLNKKFSKYQHFKDYMVKNEKLKNYNQYKRSFRKYDYYFELNNWSNVRNAVIDYYNLLKDKTLNNYNFKLKDYFMLKSLLRITIKVESKMGWSSEKQIVDSMNLSKILLLILKKNNGAVKNKTTLIRKMDLTFFNQIAFFDVFFDSLHLPNSQGGSGKQYMITESCDFIDFYY